MSVRVTPWWEVLPIRPEIVRSSGAIDDVQMSLFRAVHGMVNERPPYANPAYYGEITHPSPQFLALMGAVAVRLGGGDAYTAAPALWRLDQAMGGGKSHGLIGLYHLAEHPSELRKTDVGRQAFHAAEKIVERGIPGDLGEPQVVVLACDNMTVGRPKQDVDGPALTLAERFFWRLFGEDMALYRRYKDDYADKSRLGEALTAIGRPVLILVDEIMDYVRQLSDSAHSDLAVKDMAFLRALLDVINDVPHVAMVLVMIASEKDSMVLDAAGQQRRAELDQLLVRNGKPATINDAADFAALLRRRLFERTTSAEVVAATTSLLVRHMTGHWKTRVFDALNAQWTSEWEREVARCYPFHPQLIALAEQEWSKLAGFQQVRSTIRIFAATAHALARRGKAGEWAPLLIGLGDLPLSETAVREAVIGSGLIADNRAQANYRQLASTDIVAPDDRGGSARILDRERGDVVAGEANPRAAERAATCLFLCSVVGSRGGGRQGATEAELKAATFVPSANFGIAHADAVITELKEVEGGGLASLEVIPGKGGQAPRLLLSTRQTLSMLVRAARGTITDDERDAEVAAVAERLATTGPFKTKLFVAADPLRPPRDVLATASIDDARATRLVVLDPRQFILLNGVDKDARAAIRAVMGIGPDMLPVRWAASAVFAVANARGRSVARGVAGQYLAWDRVTGMANVKADPDLAERTLAERTEARWNLDKAVKRAYQHALYVDVDDDGESRVERTLAFEHENQSTLDGTTVWKGLVDAGRAVDLNSFTGKALLHNLADKDCWRPLDEVRDLFWSAPRMPLLPEGEADLQRAIYQAVTEGTLRLVGADGTEREITRASEIGVGSAGLRLALPTSVAEPAGTSRGVREDGPDGYIDGTGQGQDAGQGGAAGAVTTMAEREIGFTLMVNLSDPGRRDAVRDLLMRLADRIDEGSSTYGEFSMKLRVDTAVTDDLLGYVQAAGAFPSVREV